MISMPAVLIAYHTTIKSNIWIISQINHKIFFFNMKGVSYVFLNADFRKNTQKIPSRTVLTQIWNFGLVAYLLGTLLGHFPSIFKKFVPWPFQKIMKKFPDVNQYLWSQDFKFYEFIFNSSLENCIFRYRGYSWFSHACNMPLDI